MPRTKQTRPRSQGGKAPRGQARPSEPSVNEGGETKAHSEPVDERRHERKSEQELHQLRLKLGVAAESGDLLMLRAALAGGAEIDWACKRGMTALGIAASDGRISIIEDLLAHGADIDALGRTECERTPLHWALWGNQVEAVALLLTHGADVELVDLSGRTALHVAVDSGRADIVNILLKHGSCMDAEDEYEMTPLGNAVVEGRVHIADLLLKNGTDIDDGGGSGQTPLMMAAEAGSVDMIRFLIEAGADIDLQEWDSKGWTALHFAAASNRENVLSCLLSAGANFRIQSQQNETAVMVAERGTACADLLDVWERRFFALFVLRQLLPLRDLRRIILRNIQGPRREREEKKKRESGLK